MSRATDFKVGQRVRLTDEALKKGLQGYAKTPLGTVRRIDSDAIFRIFVQFDGQKGVRSYHCNFWEPASGPDDDDNLIRAMQDALAIWERTGIKRDAANRLREEFLSVGEPAP